MPVYNVTVSGKTYTVDVPNPHERPVRAIVDGEVIEVDIQPQAGAIPPLVRTVVPQKTSTPAVVPSPPPPRSAVGAASGRNGEIKAPLPGVVTSIAVKEGDRVEHGEELCVIEAMKMNNPIRATVHGTVKAIHVRVGQQVQHGAPLFTIGD